MPADHQPGLFQPGRVGGLLLQLYQQALLQVAGADARGFELLQAVQYGNDLVDVDIQLRRQRLMDVLDAGLQPAVAVRGVDQGQCDHPVGVRQAGQVELPAQQILQAFAGIVAAVIVTVEAVFTAAAGSRGGGWHQVLPLGVHRQLLGQAARLPVLSQVLAAGRVALQAVQQAVAALVAAALEARGIVHLHFAVKIVFRQLQ